MAVGRVVEGRKWRGDERVVRRVDRFEIAVTSIDWLVLLINGVLLSVLFRRREKVS
jgi:hypothetical protein